MKLELLTLTTMDAVELDGGWYAPPTGVASRVPVLMVHGLTWNFYRGPSRWLPPLLAEAGYPCLSLNMRDHDLTEPRDFELAHHDLRAGLDFLDARGPGAAVVLAHGYACNKVVAYTVQSGDARPRRNVLTTLGSIKSYRPEIWDAVLAAAPQMRGEVLVVQGAIDPLIEPRPRADEFVAAAAQARVHVMMLEGGDHYFNDRHRQLADGIISWLNGKPA